MACKFRIKPNQNIEETYQIALREIQRLGAKYVGDDTGGKFDLEIIGMRFKGIVKVLGKIIIVEILDKPLLIPCALIESSTKQYVANLKVSLK